jgi:hypothetical protein
MLLISSRSHKNNWTITRNNFFVVSYAKVGNQLADEARGATKAASSPIGDL